MPVKVYVRRDSVGLELPSAHSHETWAALESARCLGLAYKNQSTLYAVAMSLERPSADLVIISQRGIGVVEFKDIYGRVSGGPDEAWKAEYKGKTVKIKAGKRKGKARLNPHKQVQSYAQAIRILTLPFLERGAVPYQERYCYNTAVCFTHPRASIVQFRNRYIPPPQPEWEKFRIITLPEIAKWAYTISFEKEQKVSGGNYERYFLSAEQVETIATRLLGMVESQEVTEFVLTGKPFAYISLVEGGSPTQVFGLHPGTNTIGRNLNSTVPIPMSYKSVSRDHARILHSLEGTFVQDLGSKYGTYVDGERLEEEQRVELKGTHTIALCLADMGDERACVLNFESSPPPPPSTWRMTA